MKKMLPRVFFFFLCFLLASRLPAQFSVSFDAYYDEKPVRGYSYVIYADGSRIDSLATKTNKSGTIKLEAGKVYALRIIKSGFVDKLITIDTRIPADLKPEEIEAFAFDIKLTTWAGKVNNNYNDFPSALLYINASKKEFVLSKSYAGFWNAQNQ